ncbi:MAG TPA: cysteine desulfurase family protein [Acetobacteraceae bacterium]|nr:cysteine desulfurase family protein [Acetobacteraceae bacterium]
MRHYLDANASEPIRPAAREATLAALARAGNPASVHADGRAARRLLEDAREILAARFGAEAGNVVFTSGATEANALALHALGADRTTIISAVEHDSLRAAAPDALVLPVDAQGVADLDALAAILTVSSPALVCLMLANNETGALQPIQAAATLCRRYGALLHVDAVQAAGRCLVDLAALGAHSLALSSHKLGGPLGAGALLLARDASARPVPLIVGGGQERGWRGGTPALPAIAGFAAAARLAEPADPLESLRDAIEAVARAAGATVCGAGAARLPNTSCLALPGVRADAQVMALDLDGIAVSAGAACSSGKVAPSHVLAAMGLGALAGQAIRVSLPWNTSPADVAAFAASYPRMAARLRAALVPRAA